MKTNGELKIEKGIPIPESRTKKGYAESLRKLKVGDSVLLPAQSHAQAHGTAQYALGVGKYACRKMEDGYRIWRTK